MKIDTDKLRQGVEYLVENPQNKAEVYNFMLLIKKLENFAKALEGHTGKKITI